MMKGSLNNMCSHFNLQLSIQQQLQQQKMSQPPPPLAPPQQPGLPPQLLTAQGGQESADMTAFNKLLGMMQASGVLNNVQPVSIKTAALLFSGAVICHKLRRLDQIYLC